MKQWRMAIGICILLGLVGGMPGFVPLEKAAPVDAQTHTVSFPNADFETFPAGGVNDWDWPSDDWVWDGNVAYSGLHAARVSRNGGGGTQSLWSPYLFVRPSTVYTLTYWLRTENATLYPSFKVYQYTVSGTATGLPISSYPNVQTANLSWRRVALRFQTTPDADYIRLRIFLSANTKGVFWFDAFHLEEGTGAAYPLQAGFPVAVPARILLSSPVVADIDHNGSQELLVGTAAGKVEGWDASGNPLSGFPFNTGDKRIYSSLAVADLDGDGDMEIVAGTKTPTTGGHGRLFVWHHTGALVNGWPKSVAWSSYASDPSEVRSVALADIDGDGALEILAGTVNNTVKYHGSNPPSSPSAYAWHADGSPVSGTWPIAGSAIYGAIAAGDVNGDSHANFVTGRDHHYLYAYTTTGDVLAGWPVATFLDKNGGNTRTDIRIVHGSSAPALADLDGDGTAEYIVAGAVKNPGGQAIQNSALLVLAADGSRYPGWETAIQGNGILYDKNFLPHQEPSIADLDGDGQPEIVVSTYDGRIRAYHADGSMFWAFNFTMGDALFASEAVIGDINDDSEPEIIFGSYDPTFGDGAVGLWALTAHGSPLPGFPLPVGNPGIRAAPTLADLDNDGDLEILAATWDGKVYVWDVPTPYLPARLPWPTGRHDLRRSATFTKLQTGSDLRGSSKFAVNPAPAYGDSTTFVIRLHNGGQTPSTTTLHLTDTLPSGLSYVPGSLSAPTGVFTASGNVIRWRGAMNDRTTVDITFRALVGVTAVRPITNVAWIDTGEQGVISRTALIIANGLPVYLPLVLR